MTRTSKSARSHVTSSFPLVPLLIGTTASAATNPFVAQSGFLRGTFQHLIVGGGTTLSTMFGSLAGMGGGGLAGLAIGTATGAAIQKIRRTETMAGPKDRKKMVKDAYHGAIAGCCLGIITLGPVSGFHGYKATTEMINQNHHQTVATQQQSPAAAYPTKSQPQNTAPAPPTYNPAKLIPQ